MFLFRGRRVVSSSGGVIIRRFARVAGIVVTALALSACPTPFGYRAGDLTLDDEVSEFTDAGASPVTRPIVRAASVLTETPHAEWQEIPAEFSASSDQRVSIETETPDATILFTLDGSSPSPANLDAGTFVYSSPFVIEGDGTAHTIRAVGLKRLMYPSETIGTTIQIDYSTATSPQFSLSSGAYSSDIAVSITAQDAGATIYISSTVDGSEPIDPEPGSAWTAEYAGDPIHVTGPYTHLRIKAIAVVEQMARSPVASASFIVGWSTTAPPEFSVAGGEYSSPFSLSISSPTAGSSIRYTLDGTDPTGGAYLEAPSPVDIVIESVTTVRAVAVSDSRLDSAEVSATYEFRAAMPEILPDATTLYVGLPVSIATVTPGADVFYTTDGSDPNPGDPSQLYSGPFTLAAGETTVRAVAVRSGWSDSVVASRTYSVVESQYYALNRSVIVDLEPFMSNDTIDNSDGNRIPVGAVIVYRTGSGMYGKLVVLVSDASNNNGMTIRHETYENDGSILISVEQFTIEGTFSYSLTLGTDQLEAGEGDFWMRNYTATFRLFVPLNGAKFALIGVDPAFE
ncbi:MAG: hypothetical protein EA426_04405 [Spirochaetaceae bacterium]|nr:MAG: hypothetical protein EA426_04405 [Spirochaetaceae bacterium]